MFKKVSSVVVSLVCVWIVFSLSAVRMPVFAGETAAATPAEETTEAASAEKTAAAIPSAADEGNSHVVCLDPGHQGPGIDMSAQEPDGPGSSTTKAKATSGTQGTYTGIPEYALNLDVSLLLRNFLEKRGYRVIMTRTDNDTAISNSERAIMAGEQGAEIFIRIHANGEDSHQQSGALAMCPSGSNPYVASLFKESERLSNSILKSYCEATGFANLGVQYSDTMTGINWSTVPVTILEMGYMTNEFDDKQMANAEFRQIMASGIAEGIDDYFGIDTSAYEKAAEEDSGTENGETDLSGEKPDPVVSAAKPDSGSANVEAESAASTAKKDSGSVNLKPDAVMKKLLPQLQEKLPTDNGRWAVYVGDLTTGAAAVVGSGTAQKSQAEAAAADQPVPASESKTGVTAASQPGSAAASKNGSAAAGGRMQAASLIKLYIMGAVYEKYDEITKEHGKEDVDKLLHDMITVSDNDAANTLTEYLGAGNPEAGMKAVTEYCAAHGYKDSHMGRLLLHSNEFDDNYTSVQDCGLFLTRIYNNSKRSLTSMPGAQEMYDLLKQQTRTNKIPSLLPEGVHVANKTGELADVENDAGIIYDTAKGVDLVVCFMSEGVTTAGNAQTAIGEMSRFIYSYYNM